MKKHLSLFAFSIAVLAFLVTEYLPTLVYFGYRAGLINDPAVGGTRVVMQEGWFPVPKKNGWFEEDAQKEIEGVALFKINGMKPGVVDHMYIYKNVLPRKSSALLGNDFVMRTYSWGQAKIFQPNFVARVLKEPIGGGMIIALEEYDLVIHTKNISSLEEIKALVRTTTGPPE